MLWAQSRTHSNITSQSVSELSDWSQDVATMRTLTFGDRTISYEAGLDSLQPGSKSGEARLYCGLAVKLEIPTQSMTGELSSEDCLSVSLHTVLFASFLPPLKSCLDGSSDRLTMKILSSGGGEARNKRRYYISPIGIIKNISWPHLRFLCKKKSQEINRWVYISNWQVVGRMICAIIFLWIWLLRPHLSWHSNKKYQ